MNPIELQTSLTQAKEVFLYLRRWKLEGGNKNYFNSYTLGQKAMISL